MIGGEIILSVGIGVILGIITGLTPGIHSNFVMGLMASAMPATLISPLAAIFLITSLTLTHIFVEFLPTVLLGATESESFLATLPAHKMLLEGRANEAVGLMLNGALWGALLMLISWPLFMYFTPKLNQFLHPAFPFILIALSGYLILIEKNKVIATGIALLAGILGYAALNLPVKEPLLPLLSGLFGISSLVTSISNKSKVPPQKEISEDQLNRKEKLSLTLKTLLIGFPCSILPGVGGGYAALLGAETTKTSEREYLSLVGAMSIYTTAASLILVISINKARTGAAAMLQKISLNPTLETILWIMVAITISTLIAYSISKKLAPIAARQLGKINYQRASLVVLVMLITLIFLVSGTIGALIAITGGALGVFAEKEKIKKTNLMAALIIPTILYYLT